LTCNCHGSAVFSSAAELAFLPASLHKELENKPVIGLHVKAAPRIRNRSGNPSGWRAGNSKNVQKPDSTETFKYFAKFA
jgi:hypothetical protein